MPWHGTTPSFGSVRNPRRPGPCRRFSRWATVWRRTRTGAGTSTLGAIKAGCGTPAHSQLSAHLLASEALATKPLFDTHPRTDRVLVGNWPWEAGTTSGPDLFACFASAELQSRRAPRTSTATDHPEAVFGWVVPGGSNEAGVPRETRSYQPPFTPRNWSGNPVAPICRQWVPSGDDHAGKVGSLTDSDAQIPA
jgi:hypothetical protein